MTDLERLYEAVEGASWAGCAACGQCCGAPWVQPEERAAVVEAGAPLDVTHDPVVFVAGERCACLRGTLCSVYPVRPLDCRMYPLDVIEHDGELWWAIFTDCAAPDELERAMTPRIPDIEAVLTPGIVARFRLQLRVTRETWAPYRDGRFRLLRPVVLPLGVPAPGRAATLA